jgi:hypothetical protein
MDDRHFLLHLSMDDLPFWLFKKKFPGKKKEKKTGENNQSDTAVGVWTE